MRIVFGKKLSGYRLISERGESVRTTESWKGGVYRGAAPGAGANLGPRLGHPEQQRICQCCGWCFAPNRAPKHFVLGPEMPPVRSTRRTMITGPRATPRRRSARKRLPRLGEAKEHIALCQNMNRGANFSP